MRVLAALQYLHAIACQNISVLSTLPPEPMHYPPKMPRLEVRDLPSLVPTRNDRCYELCINLRSIVRYRTPPSPSLSVFLYQYLIPTSLSPHPYRRRTQYDP